ncbi:MAG: enoyl-CoA hydratase [Dehalococcoidales bacterium]|nr:enoyl-CoA hydratase [Dehalococcoidales bacterium]
MEYKRILYETPEPGIVKIMMNRPEKRNAQDALMLSEMTDAFINADLDEDVRVIIFGGVGRDFSAGHDMSGTGEKAHEGTVMRRALDTKMTGVEMRLKREDYVFLNQGLDMRNVSKPTIAMVQGNCIAGALMDCAMMDLIVASDDAMFIDPVVRMTPAAAEILFHPYDFGFRRAKEILWTGDPIDAQEAKRLGFVCKVTTREKLDAETMALARRIAMNNPVSVSLVKRSINHAWDLMGQNDAFQYHMLIHQMSHATDEAARYSAERASVMKAGGLKEALKLRDAKFKAGGKY